MVYQTLHYCPECGIKIFVQHRRKDERPSPLSEHLLCGVCLEDQSVREKFRSHLVQWLQHGEYDTVVDVLSAVHIEGGKV